MALANPQSSRVNAFRLNYRPGSRLNYLVPPRPYTGIYLWVNGAWVLYTHKARVEGCTVTQALNEVPDTATIVFDKSVGQPLKGQQVAIAQVNPYGEFWVFMGHILAVRTVYRGRAKTYEYECDCIDYTWTLTFHRVTTRYTNDGVTSILQKLIQTFAPTHTIEWTPDVTWVVIDEITFTNEDLAQAISRVCERAGLYWFVTNDKRVVVFTSAAISNARNVTPTTQRSLAYAKITKREDLSPVATQVTGRGGGSAASVDVAVGETTLPVDDPIWYPGTGWVECGPQWLWYANVSNPGTGALVGSGNAPTVAPSVAAATGSNLATGAQYGYAVSFTTAAGETLPGPITNYTPTNVPPSPPPVPTVRERVGYPYSKMVVGGSYRWCQVKNLPGGGAVPGTPTAPIVVTNNLYEFRIDSDFIGAGASGITMYRTTNGGSTFYADGSTYHVGDAGYVTTGDRTDADLAQGPTMPSGSGSGQLAASVTIPISARAGVTGRKVWRTTANGSQLKLLGTVANNSATTFLDTVADAGLGANAPITDSSNLETGGQINAGSPSILVTNISVFPAGGGWVKVGNLVLRYTGISGSSLVLAKPLPSTLSYGSEIVNAPHLTGIPASGNGCILFPIKGGDEVFILNNWQDATAVNNLKVWVGYGDGVRTEFLTDGRLSYTELAARAQALLAYRKDPLVTVTFECRDPAVSCGKTITFNLTEPPLVGTFLIQRVQIDDFPSKAHVHPVEARRLVECSSRRFTFDDLVQQLKLVGRIN